MIERENKQILVKYGGTYLRVHACRLQHAKDVKMLPECEIENKNDQTNITIAEIYKNETSKIFDESSFSTTSSDAIVDQENSQSTDNNSQNIPNEVTSNNDNSENDISESAYLTKNYTKVPKINYHIVYINPELSTREKIVIISRTSKATGKNKYWFEVRSIDTGSFMSVDFCKVKGWDYLEEEVLINNITESDNSIEILKGKINEFEDFEEVENEEQRVISVRRVITKKNKDQKLTYK